MKVFEMSDDSGFIGVANFDKYASFIGEDWNYSSIKERIIEQINLNHLLFWATGGENIWKVSFVEKASERIALRENRGMIEVTNGRLYLVNYESLAMAAQFKDMQLPENHYKDLFVNLDNGKYRLNFRQLSSPSNFESKDIDFEIVIQKIIENPELYSNKVNEICWSNH